jgi:hypothetical protein
MNRAEAARAIEESFARPSATPCTWREDRDAYIREKQSELRESLIEPFEVQAVASQWAQQYCGQSSQVRSLVAVARSGTNWLLFDLTQSEFALAFGEPGPNGPLSLSGFSSPDALAEWLG